MTATGTGGLAMPEDERMLPEMPEDDLPPMDSGEDSELGLDDMGGDVDMDVDDMDVDMDMDDMGEGETVGLDTLRRVLDDCCPDKTDMVMDAVEAELSGGEDLGMGDDDLDVGVDDDLGMGDDLGGDVDDMEECMEGDDAMYETGLNSAGMPEGDDELAMESKVAEIAGLITEDPDIFSRPRRRR